MSNQKSYRVSIVTWDVYDIWLDADDRETAEELAGERWFSDRDLFEHRHGEIDCVEAEEVEP